MRRLTNNWHGPTFTALSMEPMEKCVALCTRLAIMVNGQFKCLGRIQHLKNKFGDGYTLSLRLKGPERTQDGLFSNTFRLQILKFELKSQDISLSYVFSKLEEAQTDLNIEDYSVSQNTLDNVFINFVKQQVEISEDFTPDIHASSTRSRAVSSTNISSSSSQDDEMLSDLQAEIPLETEDDDVPLLGFGGAGVDSLIPAQYGYSQHMIKKQFLNRDLLSIATVLAKS
ncbi:LOW QUALITY PROTEIN: ABCA2-like protein, partial [Mya arenaria]